MVPRGRLLPAAVRQTLSHEADMEAIRRAEAGRRGPAGCTPQPATAAALGDANRPHAATAGGGGVVPLTLADRMRASGTAAGAVRKAAASKATWLDKLKEQKQAQATAADGGAGATGRRRFSVLYKFHEGYTNAVKRPVLMRDLLP